jgi:glycosyltransferase involved in cell wall biosynthesis
MKIYCLCDGISFPHGEATNNRILMVGKALLQQQHSFQVFVNCKRPRNPLNVDRSGNFEGIDFRHLNRMMKLGGPKWKNALDYYGTGFYEAFRLIRSMRRESEPVIYLYSQGSLFNAYISVLASLHRIPVVQEVNEWSENLERAGLEGFVYKSVMFRFASGVLAISDFIVQKLKRYQKADKPFPVILVPVLADKQDWQREADLIRPTFLWCGQLDGYLRDILLMIQAFAILSRKYPAYQLLLCGKYKERTKRIIERALAESFPGSHNVILTGYISDALLVESCQQATALLSPLWHDQRSEARFPTKLASYLFSGRPILSCQLGETGKWLSDGENVLFFEAGDPDDLARKMEFCINNPDTARQIGIKGRALAELSFDYRQHSGRLGGFFESVSQQAVKANPAIN